MEKVKLTRSSGDVFRDLGFSGDEAEYLQLRAQLMVNLQKVITARGLKQAEAAPGDPREARSSTSSPTFRGRLTSREVPCILISRPAGGRP